MENLQQGSHRLSVRDLVRLSTRIFTVKPMRTFLTIFGTSIGISTVVFLISLGYGMQYILLGRLITTQDSLLTLQAYYPQESNLTIQTSLVNDIAALPVTAEVSPVGEFQGEVKASGLTGSGILIRTVNENYFRLSGVVPNIGKQLTEQNEGVIITLQTAKIFALPENEESIGKPVSIEITVDAQGEEAQSVIKTRRDLPIQGIIMDETEPPAVYVLARSMDTEITEYKEMFIKAKTADQVDEARDIMIEKGFLISAKLDLVNQAGKILTIITIVLGVFGIAALVVSAVGMFNTMIVSFLERIYEIGVMKSLGATDSDVRNLFLMESLLMGLAGGVTGVGMGMLFGEIINLAFNILARRLGGQPVDLFITPWWFVALCIGSSAIIGLFAGFWPARRATGLSPKEAFLRK
jgi:ABC-type antimicrobial peptide transport system permease subunit